jgi:hypothetical protein
MMIDVATGLARSGRLPRRASKASNGEQRKQ